MTISLLFPLVLMTASALASPEFNSAEQFPLLNRDRFSRVAIEQSIRITDRWDPAQRDCAGFVRFLFRDTVTGRAEMWKNLQGQWVAYVSAPELVTYNFKKMAEEPKKGVLKTGDVLVYLDPSRKPADRWHLMVVLEPLPQARQDYLVLYHNGESGKKGQVKKVWLQDLLRTEDFEWRPLPGNPRFKGVFRWNAWFQT